MNNYIDSHYVKDIIFVKNNEYFTIYYHDSDALKNIIPNTKTYTKIHINELSRYTKKLSNAGYKCHYISGHSKL
jgi:hypothetical protein